MTRVTVCGSIAMCAGVLVWGAAHALSLVLPVVLIVTCAGTVSALGGAEPARSRRTRVTWWARVGATAGSIMVCLAVASLASPAWVLLCVAVLVLSSPPVSAAGVGWWRGRFSPCDRAPEGVVRHAVSRRVGGSSPREDQQAIARDDHKGRVAGLTTDDLCHVWRITFWQVRESHEWRRTMWLADLRSSVLDELESRHPDAVHRWLTSRHHTADGPARYL